MAMGPKKEREREKGINPEGLREQDRKIPQ